MGHFTLYPWCTIIWWTYPPWMLVGQYYWPTVSKTAAKVMGGVVVVVLNSRAKLWHNSWASLGKRPTATPVPRLSANDGRRRERSMPRPHYEIWDGPSWKKTSIIIAIIGTVNHAEPPVRELSTIPGAENHIQICTCVSNHQPYTGKPGMPLTTSTHSQIHLWVWISSRMLRRDYSWAGAGSRFRATPLSRHSLLGMGGHSGVSF